MHRDDVLELVVALKDAYDAQGEMLSVVSKSLGSLVGPTSVDQLTEAERSLVYDRVERVYALAQAFPDREVRQLLASDTNPYEEEE